VPRVRLRRAGRPESVGRGEDDEQEAEQELAHGDIVRGVGRAKSSFLVSGARGPMLAAMQPSATAVPRLGVNVDHVATVRQARRTVAPDPIAAAVLAELGGADGITVHLREDRRHIQERDVRALKTFVRRLNLEMALDQRALEVALDVKPDAVCLVPERREEVTTEGGLDLTRDPDRAVRIAGELRRAGIVVSAFIDPDFRQLQAARTAGIPVVELHTGSYANAKDGAARVAALGDLRMAATAGREIGLVVHAGHGLDYLNVGRVATLGGVEELNIGHAIVARAVLVGFERAVREMKQAIERAVTLSRLGVDPGGEASGEETR
jgi:pyridoxine 5-phosphate synthase